VGTLRFCGATEFASGTFAGVELDDPVGKNDGSLGGIRYFTCAPKHGRVVCIVGPHLSVNNEPLVCIKQSCVTCTPVVDQILLLMNTSNIEITEGQRSGLSTVKMNYAISFWMN